MPGQPRVVGIVAGGGSLPREIAEHVKANGGAVHIVSILGEGDRDLSDFPLTKVGWAQIGGMSGLENDLIPYGMALGNRAHLSGLNIVGLQRRGFSRADIHDLRRAYRLLFAAEGTLSERTADVAQEFAGQPIVQEILEFIRAGGKRSLCTPKEAAEA